MLHTISSKVKIMMFFMLFCHNTFALCADDIQDTTVNPDLSKSYSAQLCSQSQRRRRQVVLTNQKWSENLDINSKHW